MGQNFLKSAIALRKIVEAGEIKKDDVILEIGPGKGALTEKLLEKMSKGSPCSKVIAVEKDRGLFEFLKTKFAEQIKSGSLVLVHDDILKFSISNFQFSKYKIIANIPYNITGAILKKFLTIENQPVLMVLMVQHEVAQRIMGRQPSFAKASEGRGKESLLSISVKAYGEPKMVMKVPARYFSPAPKVDSAVIVIKNISRKLFDSPLEEYPLGGGGQNSSTPSRKRATPQEGNLEKKFWKIVRAGFAHKRKKLAGNLKNLIQDGSLASVLDLGDKRAENLTLEDWIALTKNSILDS